MRIWIAALSVALAASSFSCALPVVRELAVETRTDCQEDESCWDCTTMGNLQCGPADD